MRVLWDLAPEAKALVDPVQIQQVVVNLIRNALDAMAGASRHDLTIATLVENGAVTLAVADTGIGLPTEGAAELFKPFITSKAAGLGLGLSICRSIVEAHGGRIWASRTLTAARCSASPFSSDPVDTPG